MCLCTLAWFLVVLLRSCCSVERSSRGFTSAGRRGAAAAPRATPPSAAMRRLLLYAATAAAAQTERVLVRFDDYASSEKHRATVARKLGPEGRHWVSANRRRHPTDFLALHLTRGARRALRHLNVYEDRSTLTPLWRNLTQAHARYRVIVGARQGSFSSTSIRRKRPERHGSHLRHWTTSKPPHFPKTTRRKNKLDL